MKKIIKFFCVSLMFVLFFNVPVYVSAADDTQTCAVGEWSLETIDGRTINQDTYAGKTLLFVFYNGGGTCYNSNSVIQGLATSTWTDNENIKVIAADGNNVSSDDLKSYIKNYASSAKNIDFALNGYELLWSFQNKIDSGMKATYAFCVIVRDGMICDVRNACTSVSDCCEGLKAVMGSDFVSNSAELELGVQKHTREEIETYISTHPIDRSQMVLYSKDPSLSAPYAPGVLSPETENSALDLLNQVRYIAGVSADVKLDSEKSQSASAGTLLNYLNDTLSHYPARPSVLADATYNALYEMGSKGCSSSNIAKGYTLLNRAILQGWLSDADSSNIDRVGHRRWLLSPALESVGFGMTGSYSAVYVSHDIWNSSVSAYVAWPAQEMPIDYFNDRDPWSLSVAYSLSNCAVSVSMMRKSDGQTWNFSNTGSDGDFYVNNEGYGSPACVIFRPNSLEKVSAGDSFDVVVTLEDGIETKHINYTVNFFQLKMSGEESVRGDVSGDGKVDRKDRIKLERALAGWAGYELPEGDVADLDENGVVNRADRIYLERALAGWVGYTL